MPSKILIIDDDNVLVKMLKIRLEANGYDVIVANDGEQGMNMWKEEKPDLIILDVMMPKMDGYSFVQTTKAREDLNPVPIIVATAKEETRDLFMMEGINDYVIKPFNNEELLKKIEVQLQAKEQ